MSTEESAFFTDFGKNALFCIASLTSAGATFSGYFPYLFSYSFVISPSRRAASRYDSTSPFAFSTAQAFSKYFAIFSSDVSLSDRKYNAFNFSPVSEIVRIFIKV